MAVTNVFIAIAIAMAVRTLVYYISRNKRELARERKGGGEEQSSIL